MDWYSDPDASTSTDWSKQSAAELKGKLITANHILHYHNVVDAFGHISVRHPKNRGIYIMSGYMAPGNVASSDDLIEYWIDDSSPVNPNAKKGYSERFIHGEILKKFPDVNCVVHSHAEAVQPYVTSGVPLLPMFHMAGFLGSDVPVWDIGAMYQTDESQDMLVRSAHFGSALASSFLKDEESDATSPDHAVVLMRRHGYTTHGRSIETAVYRSIYTEINAGIQTNATLLRSSFPMISKQKPKFEFEPLTEEMCAGCSKMAEGTQDKPWSLWVKEVEKSSLYTNRG